MSTSAVRNRFATAAECSDGSTRPSSLSGKTSRVGKGLLVAVVAAVALFASTAKAEAAKVDPCGLPTSGTTWVDFADGSVPFWFRFARPGVIAAASNFLFPPRLRAAGAKTVYLDLYLTSRVGTPGAPLPPDEVVDWAHRMYYRAAASAGCSHPWMALNELYGAHTTTPWSPTNLRYRQNVLLFMQTLKLLGARPMLMISTRAYTGGEAGDWWREVAGNGDFIQEVYFTGSQIHAQGAVAGSRTMRNSFRREIRDLTDAGIPARKIGIMLGFQASNRGKMTAIAWFEHVKLQALAARQVARETRINSVWSWGWQARNTAQADPDKEVGACVWLWTRDRRLCNGPLAAGPDFNASLTQGQITLPAGVRCEIGDRRITSGSIARLARVTGDKGFAFSAAYSQAVLASLVKVESVDVLAAERGVIHSRFHGSRSAYLAALARGGGNRALALEVLADELRQQRMARRFRAASPTAEQINEYHETFGDERARIVEVKPRAWWLGDRREGLAISSLAPPQVFGVPVGKKWVSVRTTDGVIKIRSEDDAYPLGTFPVSVARPTIVAALKEIQRRQFFERWFTRPLADGLDQLRCANDELPAVAVVDLTTYLPFLTLAA
jgi:hypothetical protein